MVRRSLTFHPRIEHANQIFAEVENNSLKQSSKSFTCMVSDNDLVDASIPHWVNSTLEQHTIKFDIYIYTVSIKHIAFFIAIIHHRKFIDLPSIAALRSQAPEMAAVLPPGSPQRQRQGVLGRSPQRTGGSSNAGKNGPQWCESWSVKPMKCQQHLWTIVVWCKSHKKSVIGGMFTDLAMGGPPS